MGLKRACVAVGLSPAAAEIVSRTARSNYLRLESWSLAEEARGVLSRLRGEGWTNVIVSNHVPELPEIVSGLGLTAYMDEIFCSAAIVFEKPRREIFEHVLARLPADGPIWMIGDSISADIVGARNVGLPSILVGGSSPLATFCVERLGDVPGVLLARAG
jgi:putative hydrolase of the HAD superfamily